MQDLFSVQPSVLRTPKSGFKQKDLSFTKGSAPHILIWGAFFMLDTILLFVFVLFSVLGFFVAAVLLLLRLSAPKEMDGYYLVVLPAGDKKEYLLKIRWLQAVLAVTGLCDRITLVAVDENTAEGGISEIENELSGRKNVIIIKNG